MVSLVPIGSMLPKLVTGHLSAHHDLKINAYRVRQTPFSSQTLER